jgi:hypothetical protein
MACTPTTNDAALMCSFALKQAGSGLSRDAGDAFNNLHYATTSTHRCMNLGGYRRALKWTLT